jgi:hypothetical protein
LTKQGDARILFVGLGSTSERLKRHHIAGSLDLSRCGLAAGGKEAQQGLEGVE